MRKLSRHDKMGLKKGPWTPEEDLKLSTFIQQHGHGTWQALPSKAGLQRCGKSCRLRWINYLRPDIKRGSFSVEEDQTIIQLHALLGNRWSIIARELSKRTDNEIKNYWNSHLKKQLSKMGIDPMTHKPNKHALGCGQPNLCHMAQWESARLQAELRQSKHTLVVSISNPYTCHLEMLNAPIAEAPPLQPPCLDDIRATHISNAIFNEFVASDWTLDPSSQTSMFNAEIHHHDEPNGMMGNSTQLHQYLDSVNANNYHSGLQPHLYTLWNVLEDASYN